MHTLGCGPNSSVMGCGTSSALELVASPSCGVSGSFITLGCGVFDGLQTASACWRWLRARKRQLRSKALKRTEKCTMRSLAETLFRFWNLRTDLVHFQVVLPAFKIRGEIAQFPLQSLCAQQQQQRCSKFGNA